MEIKIDHSDRSMPSPSKKLVHLDRYFYNVTRTAEGSFGRVWILERPENSEIGVIYGKCRAAKTFKTPDQDSIVNELSNWIMLNHENILPLIKISRLDYKISALMEVRNNTLGDMLRRRTIDWHVVCVILLQVCSALEYAYKTFGLLHLDIKPENILIDTFPEKIQVSDWGISRLATEKRIHGVIGGTIPYCGPERFLKQTNIGITSDIFSLGILGIFALTSSMPYVLLDDEKRVGSPFEQMRAQICSGDYVTRAIRLLAGQPPAVRDILLACINPDPRRRINDYSYLMSSLVGIER